MKLAIPVLVLAALTGCATQQRPSTYYDNLPAVKVDAAESLFKGDASVVSDADIQKILAHKYEFPTHIRIAVLPLGQRAWWSSWSDEFAGLNANMEAAFTKALLSSNRVYDASYLPTIVVPDKRTVPYLREAAARYQADLLLMYRSDCKSYGKYRMFSNNQVRSYCSVETVILDTRTGIVPFTSTSTRAFEAEQSQAETGFSETAKKAEIEAVGALLVEAAGKLSAFMGDRK